MQEIKITENQAGQRFDKFCLNTLRKLHPALYIKCLEKEHCLKW